MWVCIFFVRTKGTFWYKKLTLLISSPPPFIKLFGNGMWEKELIIEVQCWQKNSNPWIHHSSVKLCKPHFPQERWTLGLGFFCPRWILFVYSLLSDVSCSCHCIMPVCQVTVWILPFKGGHSVSRSLQWHWLCFVVFVQVINSYLPWYCEKVSV